MLLKKKNRSEDCYFIGKVLIISVIKVKDNLYNLKYILKNKVETDEYLGFLYFDIYTDNLKLIYSIKPKMIGSWLLCEFDYYNVLLGLH